VEQYLHKVAAVVLII